MHIQPGVTIDNNLCESYNRATNRIFSSKGLSLSQFMYDKVPTLLQNAGLQYDDYGQPSNFDENNTNGCLTARTISDVISDLTAENAPRSNQFYHTLHHPSHQHLRIHELNLHPFKLTTQDLQSNSVIYIINSSSFTKAKKPKSKLFTRTRIGRIEKILFGEVGPNFSYKYTTKILDDIESFHLVVLTKVNSLKEVNRSLQNFFPLNKFAADRMKKKSISIPKTWAYFRITSFTKSFFKNDDLDSTSCLLCHCLGILDVRELTGSMALKKRSSHSGCVSVGKRQRVLDTKVKEKLDEMKKHKTYKSYLMHRVCIPRREGEAIGVIDGGENKYKNGKSVDIRSFSVRFIVSCEYGESQDHFESVSYAKDQVAIGLVRAKNKRRGGRCPIALDHVAWKTGKINGCLMSDIHL